MERGVTWAIRLVVLLFGVLVVWISYWSVIASPNLAAHPRNARLQQTEAAIVRGAILSSNGAVLAHSETPRTRRYSGDVSLIHTVGYHHTRFGLSGLERTFNRELLGLMDGAAGARLWAELTGRLWHGWDLLTTIDTRLQDVAASSLGARTGAVVAINPQDGAVLAVVSSPGFEPSRLEDVLGGARPADDPLFNRATSGQYPPGSAFKPVVLAAALESRAVPPNTVFEDRGFVVSGGRRIENAGQRAYGPLALDDALAVSSNAVFAQLAAAVGADELTAAARRFGLGARPSVPLPAASGNVPSGERLTDPAALAAMGIGQSELLVTPLQMAVAAAVIANGGWRVTPYFVEGLRSPSGRERTAAHPKPVRVISPGTAHFVREAMITAVASGTGSNAAISGVPVAGKTGTAEVGHGRPHAWFVGFAPAREPVVAVAVVVEHGGGGGAAAAPIARAVLEAALAVRNKGGGTP